MRYVPLYPWTMKHPVVADLTIRTRLAYVELLSEVGARPYPVTEKQLRQLIRKDHRESLIAAGLIVVNDDGTYDVVQPSGMYSPLDSPQAV